MEKVADTQVVLPCDAQGMSVWLIYWMGWIRKLNGGRVVSYCLHGIFNHA